MAIDTKMPDLPDRFGPMLRYLRVRAGLRQRDLAARVGYSDAHISRLEGGQRRPDPAALAALFIPALRLDRQPELAARLLDLVAVSFPSRQRADPVAYGIPVPAPCLVPRPEAADALRSLLVAHRMVVVCGLPGEGKTTLVAEAARAWAADRPVCWVGADSTTAAAPSMLVRRLAGVLPGGCQDGLEGISGTEPVPLRQQLDLLTPALAATPTLLCVDDAQLLRDAGETLAAITYLSSHGGLSVLLASRERLALPGSAPLRLGGLTPDQAAQLIDWLDPRMPPPLAERLIARTGGNPMLLRLALGQAQQPGNELARLVDRLESDPDIGDYLIDAATQRLSPHAGGLVQLLAVFRRPVDLYDERLMAQLGAWQPGFDTYAAAAELQRRQLLDHPATARLHPLIRDHLYARMAHDPAARRRLHQIAASCYDGDDEPLEAAWHHSRAGDLGKAAGVLIDHVRVFIGRGQNLPAADLVDRLVRQAGADSDRERVRRLLVVRGDLLVNTERGEEAEAAYRQALTEPMPAPVRAFVGLRLVESLLERHQPGAALELCAGVATAIGTREVLLSARLDVLRAWARIQLSEYGDVIPLARRALAAATPFTLIAPQQAGEVVARAEWALGVGLRLEKQADAEEHLRRAAAAARTAGLHHLATRALLNLGALRWEAGDMTGALAAFGSAGASARATGDIVGLAPVLNNTALTQMNHGQLTESLQTADETAALRERLGDPRGVLITRVTRANALRHLGRTSEALVILDEATEAAWLEPLARLHALDEQAIALLGTGRPQSAVDSAGRGAALAHLHVPAMAATLQMKLAMGRLILGHPELACEMIQRNPHPYNFEGELDVLFLRAALAHNGHDQAAMKGAIAELSTWIEEHDVRVHAPTPTRLRAAFDQRMPLVELPRVMWCPGAWRGDDNGPAISST